MTRLNPWTVGTALALTLAALYSACAAAFTIASAATIDFFNAWFHGLNLAGLQPGAKPFTLGVFVYGLIGLTVSTFAGGVVYAVRYNLMRLCPDCRGREWNNVMKS
ncbi:MAG: DUF5676 family membrane protein [Pseudomonadota bacterium]